jgi:hypothetical protein
MGGRERTERRPPLDASAPINGGDASNSEPTPPTPADAGDVEDAVAPEVGGDMTRWTPDERARHAEGASGDAPADGAR